MENSRTFGLQAKHYRSSRPSYPKELFQWISEHVPQHQLVWDVGTGSGQAALSLTQYFDHVYATDLSGDQIAQAPEHPSISYEVSPAHEAKIESNSVDAITVATALHWFDLAAFWVEVERVARKGALFCAWCYVGRNTQADVNDLLIEPTLDILKPYWSAGNTMTLRGYDPEEIGMPFEVVKMPEFSCNMLWTPAQIADFLRSWSGHQRARQDGCSEILRSIESNALSKLGNAPRMFELPLKGLAARIG